MKVIYNDGDNWTKHKIIEIMNKSKNNKKLLTTWLGVLQIFIGIGAVPAGISMIIDPTGNDLGMTVEMLVNTPFSNFLIPGIFLLMVNGIGSLIGGVASFRRSRYAGEIAIGLGIFLIVWIIAQIYWMGTHWLHILYLSLGLSELLLGIILRKKQRQEI